jgi:predicted DNA-binding transcriptional regulator YafY
MKYYSKRRSLIPKRVVYFNERFYLRCFDENSSEYRTYRIDRMKDITVGEKFSEKIPDDKRYDGFVADIFPPDYFENVTFRVKKFLLDEMIEQFGKNANVRDDFDNPDCAIVRVKAGINRQFYLWVMKYGDGLEIVSPKKVRDDFVTEVKKVLQKYSDV